MKLIPKVASKQETFEELLNTNKSICRFGDGEFSLMLDQNYNIGFQRSSKLLSERLMEVLSSNNENILIGIPDIFGDLKSQNETSRKFWEEYMQKYKDYFQQLVAFLILHKYLFFILIIFIIVIFVCLILNYY